MSKRKTAHLSPRKIIDNIKKLPVLQRRTAEKNYEGIFVKDWKVTLKTAHKIKGETYHLGMLAGPIYPWIYIEIKLSEHPEVKIMPENTKLTISGTIDRVRGHVIELKNTHIKSREKTKQTKKNALINIKDSQVHFGKGDNIVGNKLIKIIKTKRGKEQIGFYAILMFIIAVISIPYWPSLLAKIYKQKIYTNEQNTQIDRSINNIIGTVRALNPLETGKKIGELSNGVYFFAHYLAIKYELEESDWDYIRASSQDSRESFEIQKSGDRYYVIGFISDEAQSKTGMVFENPIYTQLFPNRWGGAKNLVAIPLNAIYTIHERKIDLDELKSVTIFDVGFKEVVENPEFHKTIEL
jgi:hypothetical protein